MRTMISWAGALGLGIAMPGGSIDAQGGGFAEAVVGYEAGVGYATDWASGEGYTDHSAALGSPSRMTVDPDPQWGGTFPVSPFAAPYLRSQIVSIGEGGSLTVRLGAPAVDDPAHPHGLDFLVYGSAAFVITNGDFTGGGVTDGSLFGATEGETRVSVSADGVAFYELHPSLAPRVDALFPTDGTGDFSLPVDPSLGAADFSELGLAGIQELYAGSGGGTGFDLAWARDAAGNPVALAEVHFLRVAVLSGHAEIDGFSVIPEPSPRALLLLGLLAVSRHRVHRPRP